MNLKIVILTCLLVLFIALQTPVQAQTKLQHFVFGNGAAVCSGNGCKLLGTTGQPAIGIMQGDNCCTQSGFWCQAVQTSTDVEQISEVIPKEFRLHQNYPNPFNPQTTISFALPKSTHVRLLLFDMLGRSVATLVDEKMQPGIHKVTFNATGMPTGIYFYRIETEQFTRVKKALFVK